MRPLPKLLGVWLFGAIPVFVLFAFVLPKGFTSEFLDNGWERAVGPVAGWTIVAFFVLPRYLD